MKTLTVTVTQAHVDRARELTLMDGSRLSECCPVTLALYDALGRPVSVDALLQSHEENDNLWTAGSAIGIDHRQYAAPPVVAKLVDWFDGWGDAHDGPPLFPITFTVDLVSL